MLDGEQLALLSLGYRRVFFAELHCRFDGAIRIATELEPGRRHPCPICGEIRHSSGVYAIGYSKRELPFFEIVMAPDALRLRSTASPRYGRYARSTARVHA